MDDNFAYNLDMFLWWCISFVIITYLIIECFIPWARETYKKYKTGLKVVIKILICIIIFYSIVVLNWIGWFKAKY